jgi:hypothetical protein
MAAIGGALVLLLSACGGNEAGPTPKQGGTPGPDALPLKLTALTADQCFLKPDQQQPKGCEKYVTELGNTAAQVRQRAGVKDVQLAKLADQLDKAVGAYRGNTCNTVDKPGNGPCTQAVSDIAAALNAIKTSVDSQPTTS